MRTGHRGWLLSGGIGSGKSTVRKLFEERGFSTIDADSIGHEVLAPGGSREDEVAEIWSSVVVDGVIDRGRLADIVFADPEELARLESITHPAIFDEIQRRAYSANQPVIVELPILKQPFKPAWPRIVVDAPRSVQMKRAVERGARPEDFIDRISAQPNRVEWLTSADAIIPNRTTIEALRTIASRFASFILDAYE